MFYYEETASYDLANYPSSYGLNAQYVTDSYGNSYWNTHPLADPSGNVIEYTWHFNRNTEYNDDPDYGRRIIPSIVMADQNDYTQRLAYVVNTNLPDFKLCFTGLNRSIATTVTLRLSDAYSDNYIDHTITVANNFSYDSHKTTIKDITVDSSQYYRVDPSDITKKFSVYSRPYPKMSTGFDYTLSGNSGAIIVYDASDLLEYVESGNITIPVKYGEAFNFSIKDASKYTDPSIHLVIDDEDDPRWGYNMRKAIDFQIYYPLTSIHIVPKAEIIPSSPQTTISELQDSSIMPALHNYYSSTNERYFPDEAVFQWKGTGDGMNLKEWGIQMVPDVSRLMDVSVVLDGSVLISYNNSGYSYESVYNKLFRWYTGDGDVDWKIATVTIKDPCDSSIIDVKQVTVLSEVTGEHSNMKWLITE